MRVEVVTVKGPALSRNDVEMVVAPGIRGEFTVLPNHIPFLSGMRTGVLVVRRGTQRESFAVGPGFVEVGAGDRVIVLTEAAETPDQVDLADARGDLEKADAELKTLVEGTPEHTDALARKNWALSRIEVASKK